jgi:hypothetical protein
VIRNTLRRRVRESGTRHWRLLLLFGVSMLLAAESSFAMDSTVVLPESVNSPSVRMGIVSGIGFKFMSSGDMMSQGEVNSVEFDVRQLSQFEPRVNQLVAVLNQFGPNKLGDELSLGVLRVDTVPEIRYFAPVYARGITANWTLGFGVPILKYKNKISLSQSGSNIEAIRAQVGSAIPQVNSAFNDLSVNLATKAQETLASKGYKPLVDRDETQIGDLQLVSIVQFAKRERSSFQFKTVLSLPTGQGNDPDDLADLGAFGYLALENQILGNYILNGRWQLAAKTGYRYTFADRVARRVPLNETDSLPDQSTKETVARATGGAVFVGGSVTYSATETIDLAAGIESTRKAADSYDGSRGTRYDLLSSDTSASSDRIRLGVTYSSVETFLAGKAWLPTMIAYEFSDTLRGINTERQTIHEIWLQLFF